MSNHITTTDEATDGWKAVYTLPTGAFSASDRARLNLAAEAKGLAEELGQLILLLAHDPAEAGDYADALSQIRYLADELTGWALTAEVVRGTSWERIADKLGSTVTDSPQKWRERVTKNVESMNSNARPTDYGTRCRSLDNWIATLAMNYRPFESRPIGPVLDASAPWTGRDAAKADRAFTVGLPAPRDSAPATA